MKRRDFLTHTTAAGTLISLGGIGLSSCTGLGRKHITILHTNDVHSHIDPFPISHSQYPNLGGVARRATLVDKIRDENPNTLLFDAGDIFQGTPYFNFYGGELEFKLMSKLRYDAATIGNHDFDNGVEGLLAQVPHASFELISANYNFSNTVMDGYVKPYKTYLLDGIQVGVYGIGIGLDGLVLKRLYKETEYLDPFEIALDMEKKLKEEEQCDLIICLSHLGYAYENPNRPCDILLAQRTYHTHLIIGGHTHTFLEKPDVRTNKNGESVLVNQVGAYGINLGRIDFYFDSGKETSVKGVSISV
ncbi:bifunctional metallophosphatase/5'-nucleotidase [Muricauda sp. JGD-17]|uniref:Bifunctional metallophosphatase/5'-nucleotidase n=1 Tax=Flagellimonas ochracea TaxID=2696472 RepID=A0A964T9H1_9FLAO|nr:metallophosphatase [Allomuricauda ochracea]NAY90703.1 bifunctional metallophosphatase/5'-nucleotidase [Allomuricauda ochracea]